jgi:hypothetical protein
MPQKRMNHSAAAVGTARITRETGEFASHATGGSIDRMASVRCGKSMCDRSSDGW